MARRRADDVDDDFDDIPDGAVGVFEGNAPALDDLDLLPPLHPTGVQLDESMIPTEASSPPQPPQLNPFAEPEATAPPLPLPTEDFEPESPESPELSYEPAEAREEGYAADDDLEGGETEVPEVEVATEAETDLRRGARITAIRHRNRGLTPSRAGRKSLPPGYATHEQLQQARDGVSEPHGRSVAGAQAAQTVDEQGRSLRGVVRVHEVAVDYPNQRVGERTPHSRRRIVPGDIS